MARNADYVLPGHHEPIGTWPTEQLWNAYQDLHSDLQAGFGAPEAKTALTALGEELTRREKGGERQTHTLDGGVSRALERWLPEEASALPAVRGQAQESGAVASAPVLPEARVEPMQAQALQAATELTEPERRPILSLVWEKTEIAHAVERDAGPEPG